MVIIMSLTVFIHKYRLTYKAITNIKIQQIFSSVALSDVGNFLIDGQFLSEAGIVKFRPTEGTHWVA